MSRLILTALTLIAGSAFAQTADFETANRQLNELSYAKACDTFTAYLKATGDAAAGREAVVKKIVSCANAGRDSFPAIEKLGSSGPKDFARAYAAGQSAILGMSKTEAALELLKPEAKGDSRQAHEASALVVRLALTELERNNYDRVRAEAMAQVAIGFASNPNDIAHAKFLRAQSRFNDPKTAGDGEKEMAEVAAGATDWADDATYSLGSRKNNQAKYSEALALFESASRFSAQTANMRSSSLSQAAEIKRKQVSVSISNFELPGQKPKATVWWRNVKNATYTLKRVDPSKFVKPDPGSLWASGEVVSTWKDPFDVASAYAPGNKELELSAIKQPGAYLLEVSAGTERAMADVLVTNLAIVTKTDRNKILVWVSDVETGVGQAGAEVAVFYSRGNSEWRKEIGKADATGLATFTGDKNNTTVRVWAHVGENWSVSGAGDWYGSDSNREELAYAMTDRPIYKPNETVGLKIFLRSREGGPSTALPNRKFQLYVNDPTGKTVAQPMLTTSSFGTASFSITLPKNATLGAYNVTISSSTDSYQQQPCSFRVEEYKPPEYSVSVEAVGNPRPGETVKFKVKASYFSGGAVSNAQGRALVRVLRWAHTWGPWVGEESDEQDEDGSSDGYPQDDEEYGYRRRYRSYNPELAQYTVLFKTGADGTSEFEVPKAAELTEASVQYSAQVLITDSSRREIAGAGSVQVVTTPYFVDVRSGHYLYKPGEKVGLQLRAEDPNGRPVDAEVVVRLVRVTSDGKPVKIAEARTKIVKGRGASQLDADALGMVRVEVADAAKPEVVLAQSDLWLTNEAKPMTPPNPGFQLFTDRGPLKVGHVARVLVVTDRPGGHVLLTLENELIQASKVVELTGRARYVELPVTAAMSPNAFLGASRFENAEFRQLQRPISVAGSDVALAVKVELGRPVVEPGSSLNASVVVKNGPVGAPVEIAMTVVDEALFALEKERTDFMTFFGRHRRQLTVRTMSTMNERGFTRRAVEKRPAPSEVLGTDKDSAGPSPVVSAAPASAEDSRMNDDLASGARREEKSKSAESESAPAKRSRKEDAEQQGAAADPAVKVRTDFGTSAGWYPVLTGTVGAPLSQKLKLTDSLTSWKAIATVVSEGPHLGQGHDSVKTAKALMVRLQAPRFFIENDEVILSAVIESHLPTATDIEVSIGAPGLKAMGPASKTVRVTPEQISRFDARFKVSELGDRTIRATVKGGGTSDAMEWKLPALVHGSAQRQFFSGRLTDSFKVEFDLPEKRKASLTNFELVMTPSVLSAMFDSLPYLAQYPYGCVEQTLSRFVPAVIARKAAKDFNLSPDRVPAKLDDMVAQGLDRLASFQHSDGGWGWWHDDHTNLWMTAYVVYALGLAKEAGAPVNAELVTRGRGFLTEHLGEGLNEPETHAFMVFALSSTGSVPKAAIDADFAIRTKLTARARGQLALAMLNAKDSRARIAVENLDDVVKAAQSRKDASVGEANDAWSTSAAIEATAFTLMAMIQYDLKSPLIAPLTDFLVLRRNGGKWRNTRDTAFAVYALAALAKREGASLKSGSFVVFVNGKEVKRIAYSKGGLDLVPLTLPDSALKPGHNVIEVKRDASGTGYFAATFDVFNQNDFIKGVGGDVKIKRTYTLLGKPSTEKSSAPTEYGMPVESGTRVRVDLDITANKAVEFVMIEDLKAAGFEAVMLKSGPEVCNYACAHAELRSDRVAMFLPEVKVGTTRLSYELRAEVPGRFAALPARAEAMYAPEIQATADEMRFEVRDEPTSAVSRQ